MPLTRYGATDRSHCDFPARYYSSNQGRWYSPDWASANVPVPYADLHNPQTLNLYAYVGNDPTNHPDADGHAQTADNIGFKTDEEFWQRNDESGGWGREVYRSGLSWVIRNAVDSGHTPVLGIGIEVPEASAVHNNTLNVAADQGHTFVYVKDASGRIVAILSFGPGQPIGRSNKSVFTSGNISGNAHWPLTGDANTWEFRITPQQMTAAVQAISDFKASVPNYTPTSQCTSAALGIAERAGIHLPTGVGPVIAREYGYTAYSGNVANPYHLNQQMIQAHGSPTVVNTSRFPAP